MGRPDASLWQRAMEEELVSLAENQTWNVMEAVPPGARAIPTKWIYKLKRDATGRIERYKARLVVKGYMQREGVDFDEVYAPVMKHASLRVLLSLVARDDLELHQLDVKTAFLYGELDEDIYVTQPPGFSSGSSVYKLRRSLYGLKQAPRAWHKKLHSELELLGFHASQADPGLYYRKDPTGTGFVLVWVDDMLVAGSAQGVAEAKEQLKAVFKVHDLGEPHFSWGWR
jgi:hypothetical protein